MFHKPSACSSFPLALLLSFLCSTLWGCAQGGHTGDITNEVVEVEDNLGSNDDVADLDEDIESDVPSDSDDSNSPSDSSGNSTMLNGRCEGNYLFTLASELALIENCREITGSLTFNGVVFESLDLPRLTHIGESLFIHEIQGLNSLAGLSSLEHIGKHLKVTNTVDLESLDGLENL
ncbi:MAG: hypothetical protein HOK97_10730, partial [Deltaproteobacteria bacterium]|nr:hypothetical protein [Deltaproteobacteria bacterium]